ncbi:MAG: response regulator [Rhodospirillaceae bacterium]
MTFTDHSLESRIATTAHQTPKRVGDSRPCRILLVDDDPDFVEILSENLRHEGHDTILHTRSESALAWLHDGSSCDLILLDWYMPELPGIALLRAVRDAGIDTPVIVLTGVNKEEIEDTALGCGAVDFVDKTRRFSVLLKRIGIALENATMEADGKDDAA